jgi:hypothetical protein
VKLQPLVPLALLVVTAQGCSGPSARQAVSDFRCPGGIPLAGLLRSVVSSPSSDSGQPPALVASRTAMSVAPGFAFYSVRESQAPERETKLFAVASSGAAFRIAGFSQLDLAAFSCGLKGTPPHTSADAWRTLYQMAQALAPFIGRTYLLGVTAPGVEPHQQEAILLSDSTGFPHPSMQASESGYRGAVAVMWQHESRVHVVEWRFMLRPDGTLGELHERLLAGQTALRDLAFTRG